MQNLALEIFSDISLSLSFSLFSVLYQAKKELELRK